MEILFLSTEGFRNLLNGKVELPPRVSRLTAARSLPAGAIYRTTAGRLLREGILGAGRSAERGVVAVGATAAAGAGPR